MLYNQDEEEYKKRLEEAKQLRQSAGMVTNAEKNNKFVYDNEYQSKLDEAKKLRESVGMITHEEEKIEIPEIEEPIIDDINIHNELDTNNFVENNDIDISKKEENILQNPEVDSNDSSNTGKINNITDIKEESKKFFQAGEFSDGYQFGDITKTTLGTTTDTIQNFAKGLLSVPEGIIDVGTNLVATIQDILGFNESAKKTREFANTDLSNNISSKIANATPIGMLYNLVNGTPEKIFNPAEIEYDTNKNFIENYTSGMKKAWLTDSAEKYEESSVSGEMTDQIVELVGYTLGLATGEQVLSRMTGTKAIGNAKLGADLNGGNIAIRIAGKTLNLPTLAITGGMSEGLQEANAKGENVTELERWSKALSGGLVEGVTEGLFGFLGVGGNELTDELGKKLASRFTSKAAKILTNLGFHATGEAAEEFLSYAGNFLIDNGIIDKIGYTDFSSEWNWEEVFEQMLLAFLSTGLTGGSTMIVNTNSAVKSAQEQLGRDLTQEEKQLVTKAVVDESLQKKIQEMYDKENIPQEFYISIFNSDGEIADVQKVRGKPIINPNEKVNVSPAIVRTGNNVYIVIDSKTGLKLDTTPYNSLLEAESGFNSKMINLKEREINAINSKVGMSNFSVTNTLMNTAQLIQDNIILQSQDNQTTNDTTLQEKINTTNSSNNNVRSERIVGNNSTNNIKQEQLNIIQKTNPMQDDYHTGIRTVDDIKTFQEAYDIAKQEATDGGWTEYASYPDITNEMIDEALNTGKITVYSSNTIKNGTFVTPSYEQALEYAGNDSSKVKSRVVYVDNVAWINLDEGQYAKVSQSSKTSKVAKSSKIQYNENGIQLGKREYANVTSLINTNKPNDTGIQSINSSDYFYAYENNGFDNNRIFLRIKIEGNEELINFIRKDISNGNIKGTEDTIRLLENYEGNGRRYNNSDNVTSQRGRADGQSNLLHTRQVETERETNQGRNNQESNRNKSRIDNKSNVQYNKNGIKLSKQEYTNVMSLISTNKPTKLGKHYINSANDFYVYYNNGFGNNTILAKIPIEGNEARIKSIREEIFNERVNQKGETSNTIIRQLENERGRNNNNDAMFTRRNESEQNGRLHNRNEQEKRKNRGREDSNKSTRNKSEVNNKPNVENSSKGSFSLVENTSMDNGIRYEKINRENSKNKNTIDKLVEDYINRNKNDFNTNIDIDTNIVSQNDNIPIDYTRAKQSTIFRKAKELFSSIKEKYFTNNEEKIFVTNTDISESISHTIKEKSQKVLMKENISVFSRLGDIIKNGTEISQSLTDNKGRTEYRGYKYYVTKIKIDGEPYVVEFDTRLQLGESGKQERHFRLERIYKVNEEGSVTGAENSTSQFDPEPSSNNSITQNRKEVKNENKKKMYIKVDSAIQKELHNRIINATLSKNSRKNTFLGIVSDKVANKIKSLLGIDVTGRKHMLSDYDIRHILKQHGNAKIEESKGQIAITKTDIEKIPDIITNYDNITKGSPNKNVFTKKMQDSIRYEKKYDDNILYVVEVVPENSGILNIKTMWKKPITLTNSQKTPSSTSKTKGNLSSSTLLKNNSASVSHGNNTLPYTSETKPSSSYSKDSITQNRQEVKNEPFDERKVSDDREYYRQQRQNNYLSQITPEQGATNAQQSNANKLIEDSIRELEETGAWDNSIPVTKLIDIRKEIEKYLGFGIYKGHFRQHAYGIYNQKNDSIRVKEYKDIDNILHETGHALDIGKRLNVDKSTIADELFEAVDKHGGYENETREVRLEEGFAEVIRTYAIRPDLASSNYPNTTAILEGIRAQDKSFDNFIGKIQNMTYNYIHQNPRNRELSNQSIGKRTDEAPRTARSIKESIAKAIYDKDYVLKETVSEFAKASGKSMKDVAPSRNAYILTRLASGVQNKAISMISDGYIDLNGNKVMPGLNQLGEILGNNPERFNDLRAYLVANRDLDYKSKNLKTGIRTSDSKAVVNQFKNDSQIQEAAKVVYDTLDGVLKYATDNGLISKETADSLKESNAFYVPFQRVLENDRGNQVGRRGSVIDIIRKRTGSELDIKDVLENIVVNSANIIQQVENNNVLRALYKQGEEAGIKNKVFTEIPTPMKKIGTATLATWENELQKQGVDTTNLDLEKTIDIFAPNNKIDRQNLITSFIDENGKRVYLQFAQGTEDLFNSVMNLDSKMMSYVLRFTRAINMPLRYGATMANVGFAIPNMISDTVQATIYSEAGFVPVVDNAIGVLDVLTATNKTVRKFMNKVSPEYAKRINNLYAIYQQTGASSSTRMSQYRRSVQEIMGDVYGTNSKNMDIDDKFRPLKNLLDVMTYIPELSESSTRFRVFERNYENYKNKGGTELDARIKAAIESRDATQDFGRTGTVTRELNQLIPFSAARVGSAYTFSEKISANPKVVGAKIALLSVIAMAIKAIGYDDDEIEELNQRKKDDNFVLKIGDTVVTIKKPQGILRSIVNLTEYIQDLATGHIEEGKEAERLGEWLNNAIMDNMPADEITGLVPNAVAPLIENAINKDFYYNKDIVKSYDTDLPDSQQYYDYNSQLAILLGSIFNYSPAKIDNLISGYFGGLGTTVTNVIDWISGKVGLSAEEPNMGAEDGTIGKRFVVNVNENSQSVDDVYTRQEELTKKQNGGTITEEETQELEKIKEAVSKMAALNKQIKAIKQDKNMSGDEKAEQIRPLQEQKTDVARQALGKEPIYTSNTEDLEALKFYPSRDTLSSNGLTLTLTEEMKKEYQDIAYAQYKKYANQGLYSSEYLEKFETKCKDAAKKQLMQKYKNKLEK